MNEEPIRTYRIGKYGDGFGPGKAGLFWVEQTTIEVIALAEDNVQAERIAKAFRDAKPRR